MLEFSKIASRYSVVRKLYSRGVTNAFLVRDERLDGQQVVAEITPIERDETEGLLDRRRAVIGLLGQLEHPNLAGLIEVTVDEPYLCVIKTWDPGVSLEDWLAETAPDESAQDEPTTGSWRLRVALVRDILEGLAALHSAGLLHRDLRPRNIWITTSGGRPMAQLDHFLDAIPEDDSDGRLVGEPRRRAPEVVRSGDYSRRSDIYSAGLLLLDLLAEEGFEAPEAGISEEALLSVPAPYSEVVRRACRPFGVERFDDGLDLLAAFDAMDLKRRLAEAGFDEDSDFGDD